MTLHSSHRQKKLFPAIILIIAGILLFVHPSERTGDASNKLLTNVSNSLVPDQDNNADLATYKRISDSLEKIKQWKQNRLKKGTGDNFYTLFMGVRRIDECDSCADVNEKNTRSKYFVSFYGFELKENTNFHIDRNEYFIDRSAAAQSEKTNIRLASTDENSKGLTLLMPVSVKEYNWIKAFVIILFVISVMTFIWIFIWLPVRVLMNIARGKAFNEQNVRSLSIIGWVLIGGVLFISLMPKLIEWILSSRIPAVIYFPFWSVLFEGRWILVAGIAILLLASAFRSGNQLQQEQDLTI